MKPAAKLSLFFSLLFATLTWLAWGYARDGTLLPLLVSALATVLSVIQLLREGIQPQEIGGFKDWSALGWLASLLILTVTVGLLAASGVWTLFWLRHSRAESWAISLGMAAGIPLLLFLLFEGLLRLELYQGLLMSQL